MREGIDHPDARLIAAAPDLLATVQAAMPLLRSIFLDLAAKYAGTEFENDPEYRRVEADYRNALAAIAKAEGRAA
jgi:hypothetical protein